MTVEINIKRRHIRRRIRQHNVLKYVLFFV